MQLKPTTHINVCEPVGIEVRLVAGSLRIKTLPCHGTQWVMLSQSLSLSQTYLTWLLQR